jgi:hypothetical protein
VHQLTAAVHAHELPQRRLPEGGGVDHHLWVAAQVEVAAARPVALHEQRCAAAQDREDHRQLRIPVRR